MFRKKPISTSESGPRCATFLIPASTLQRFLESPASSCPPSPDPTAPPEKDETPLDLWLTPSQRKLLGVEHRQRPVDAGGDQRLDRALQCLAAMFGKPECEPAQDVEQLFDVFFTQVAFHFHHIGGIDIAIGIGQHVDFQMLTVFGDAHAGTDDLDPEALLKNLLH